MIYGVSHVVYYRAWDTSANGYKTGDSGNHTLYWNKDGSAGAVANSPAEVDATNQPGLYKLTLTTTETECVSGALHGKSSTADVILVFNDVGPVRLPNAAPGAENGLPTLDANQRVSANVTAMAADVITAAALAADAGAELAALVETYIVNEGDATAVMQAIADLIAADWVAGDASPLAIASAVRTNLTTELGRIDAAISTRSSFDASTDKVYLGNGAHGGAAATLTLSDYSDFLGEASELTTTGIATAVWLNGERTLTQAAASVVSAVTGTTITVYRGARWSISLTGLGDISSRTKLYFTVKANKTEQEDASALLKIEETIGLQVFNGSSTVTPAHASLTVDNESTGAVTIVVDEDAGTADLTPQDGYAYGIRQITADGPNDVSEGGTFNIEANTTRAVS